MAAIIEKSLTEVASSCPMMTSSAVTASPCSSPNIRLMWI